MSKFYLPDLGEGLQGAEIIEWKVKPGDQVEVDQLILVVETAKAVVEIPSPVNAIIDIIHCAAGDTVDVGEVLMEFKEEHETKETEKSVSVVGNLENAKDLAFELPDEQIVDENYESTGSFQSSKHNINASPSIRAFAERLGIEDILSAHAYGVIDEARLLEIYAKRLAEGRESSKSDNSIVNLKGARKVMAQTMSRSHEQIPSVTLFDDANISTWSVDEDITIRCIEAVIYACKVAPILNAWFDEESMSIQLFEDVHLGVAVNSEEGLFVPVIRKAQTLDNRRIREILKKQITSIRNRTIKPQKLLGATVSISNFGSLSGRYATPIIVPPQVAIIGVGKIKEEPVIRDQKICIGRVMPLSLSFDHRAASGAEAARFMQAMIKSLER